MRKEFEEILADVKEQILFLQELGVDELAVELPEFDAAQFRPSAPSAAPSAAPTAPPPAAKIAAEQLERFAPPPEIVKRLAEPAAPKTSASKPPGGGSPTRLGLLEATKLSRRDQRPPADVPQPTAPEPKEPTTMPKPKAPTEDLSNSLFGDITQNLPESNETLEAIRADIGNCTRCPLHEGRTKIVHSTGNLKAELMFVGEAPGADEDQQGAPFVGRAGQLLNKIIEAIGMRREDVFIGNINRCRPPGNRTPTLPEAHTCRPFLIREIAVVRPKVIVVLGNTACQNLLDTKVGITRLRGNFQDYYGVRVMPTFHPAYLLRDPSKKRETWEDMKKVRDYLNGLK